MSQQQGPGGQAPFLSFLQGQQGGQPAPAFPSVNPGGQLPSGVQQPQWQPPGVQQPQAAPQQQFQLLPGGPHQQGPAPAMDPQQIPAAWQPPASAPMVQPNPAQQPTFQGQPVAQWPQPAPAQPPAAPFQPPPRVETPPANGKKKGRPRKAVDLGGTGGPVPGEPLPPGWPQAAPAEGTDEGFTLYIDCMPLDDGEKVYASALCDAAATMAAQQAQVQHYALIEYGKGPGFLQTCLAQILGANAANMNGADVILMTGSKLETDCLPAFKSAAARVVVRL